VNRIRTLSVGLLAFGALFAIGAQASSAVPYYFFQSPSHNIGCIISKRGVRCDIRKKSWSPPMRPAFCFLDWGNGVTVDRHGKAEFTCAGDTALGYGKVLRYGYSVRVGRFRCLSKKSDMRCFNRRNGHGFKLSRQRARLF